MIEHPSDDVLSAQLDGVLGGDETNQVTAHLSGCAECTHRLALMEATARAISALPDEPLPAPLDLSFLAPQAATDPLVLPLNRRWRPPTWAAPVLAAAAVLLVAVTVGPGLLAHRGGAAATASSGLAGRGQLNEDAGGALASPTPGALAQGVAPPGAAGAAAPGAANPNPQFAATPSARATRTFPQSGGLVLNLAAGQQTTPAGQPVSLTLTVRASSQTVQVQRVSITVRRGTASQQVVGGSGETISPSRPSTVTGTWNAGQLGSGQATSGDYEVDGIAVLADGTSLGVSFTIHVS